MMTEQEKAEVLAHAQRNVDSGLLPCQGLLYKPAKSKSFFLSEAASLFVIETNINDGDIYKIAEPYNTPKAKPQPSRNAAKIAQDALQHISDRAATYDQADGERSAVKCAAAFNAITGKDLTESDVWLLLAILKMVRQFSTPDYHKDSAEDLIAYSALLAESLEKQHETN